MKFVSNPSWVNAAIGRVYSILEDKVKPEWLPLLGDGKPTRGGFAVKPKEYGCGAYGCVLPTHDDDIVLKVTTDTTEAEFAAHLAPSLAARVTVDYLQVIRLSDKHDKRPIHLLWRESAAMVGQIDKGTDGKHDGRAEQAIRKQHGAAQVAYESLVKNEHHLHTRRAILEWISATEAMGDVDELKFLASGMLKVWNEQRIFFGDIHAGNLGLCERGKKLTWVITDPGHVAVIDNPAIWSSDNPAIWSSDNPAMPRLLVADYAAVDELSEAAKHGVRFGARKVFLSTMVDMTDPQTRRVLLALRRDGLIELARADLVSAMDPELVQASELDASGAVFHFFVVER